MSYVECTMSVCYFHNKVEPFCKYESEECPCSVGFGEEFLIMSEMEDV